MRFLRSPLFLAVLGVFTFIPAHADEIDDIINAHLAKHQVPGLSLAIVKDGAVTRAGGYGFANLEHKVPATEHTVYQIGSIGKMFTAAAILRMQDEGKLSVTDSIRKHFPEAPASWEGVTVHHLLNHTSGIGDFPYGGPKKIDLQRNHTDKELAALVFAQPAQFKPGEKWDYNNAAYVLLGLLINRVNGAHFGDYLQAHFFAPLDIRTARVISDTPIIPHRAAGYEKDEKGNLVNQEWVSPTYLSTGDGSLYFTVEDFARWDIALDKGTPVSPAMLQIMWQPTRLSDGKTELYGYGWELDDRYGHTQRGHGGGWQGFNALYCRFPEKRTSIILFSNLSRGHLDDLMKALVGKVVR